MSTIAPAPPVLTSEDAAPPITRRRRGRIRWGMWISLAVIALFGFAPVYWLLVTSLTPTNLVFTFPPTLFPREISFDHYATVLGNPLIFGYLRNSVIVSVITAVLAVAVSMYMGYAFSKYRFAAASRSCTSCCRARCSPRPCCW